MLCKVCGKINIEMNRFCDNCGEDFEAKEELMEESKIELTKELIEEPKEKLKEDQKEELKEEPKKKPRVLILVLVALFIMAIGAVAYFFLATDPIEEMRASLEEIDSTSYVDIMNWIENELPEFEDRLEDFDVTIRSLSAEGRLIQNHFINRPSRFIEWQFMLDEHSLGIDFTYLTMEEYVIEQLSQLDRSSFAEITSWIKEKEDEAEIDIRTIIRDTDGNSVFFFTLDWWEEFFVEWDYEVRAISNRAEVSIEFIYRIREEIALGETFEFLGIEFTFVDEISGYRVDYPGAAEVDHLWGRTFFRLPVLMRNVSEESIDISKFDFRIFEPDGTEMEGMIRTNDAMFAIELEPGGSKERSLHFYYRGEGEYVVELSDSLGNSPVTFQVIVSGYNIDIPDWMDWENLPLPDVVYDLQEGDLVLINHDLSPDSFFYTDLHESELGHNYRLLRPGDIVRDPEGVVTFDSLRMGYNVRAIDWDDWEDGFDAVVVAEDMIENLRREEEEERPFVLSIRASEDRSMALLHARGGGVFGENTMVIAVSLLPCGEEYVMLGSWIWTINEAGLVGERRAAIEEFGRLTGIDYIAILRGY